MTVVGESPRGPACLVGVLERGRAFGVLYARRDGDDVLLEAELAVEARLEPGEVRPLERVRVALGLDAERPARGVRRGARAARVGAHGASPFLSGWCSWYHFFERVSEADVLRNLEALAAARPEIAVDVVQIDDGYQRAIGDWLETNAKFPRGLAPLAAEIRAAGFIAGHLDGALLRRSPRAASSRSTRTGCCAAGTACCAGCCIRPGAATPPSTCSIRAGTRCARISSPSFASCARSASTT